jgi:hypothetical protein
MRRVLVVTLVLSACVSENGLNRTLKGEGSDLAIPVDLSPSIDLSPTPTIDLSPGSSPDGGGFQCHGGSLISSLSDCPPNEVCCATETASVCTIPCPLGNPCIGSPIGNGTPTCNIPDDCHWSIGFNAPYCCPTGCADFPVSGCVFYVNATGGGVGFPCSSDSQCSQSGVPSQCLSSGLCLAL